MFYLALEEKANFTIWNEARGW